MQLNRINFITLVVEDLDRARLYYETLGWVASGVMPKIAFYAMRGQKFALATRDLIADEIGDQAMGVGAMTLAQNYPSAAEVDEAFEAAIAAGAREVAVPTKREWGGYSAYVADPDGHLWEFAFNPFSPLDEAGQLK